MTTRFCLCLAATIALLGTAGCSSDDEEDASTHRSTAHTAHHQKKSDDDDDDHDMNKPPRVGMTKAQVRAAYGEPNAHEVTDEGEVWVYRLNFGDAVAASFNPFDFGEHSRVRTGRIYFGSSGRVRKFNWDVGHSDN